MTGPPTDRPDGDQPTEAWTAPPQSTGPIIDASPSLSSAPATSGSGWVMPIVQTEVAPGLTYASTTSRVAAYVVDTFLLGIVASIVALAIPGSAVSDTNALGNVVVSPVYNITSVFVGAVYFIGFWSGGRRATLGQMLFKIQVANAVDGRALTLDQALRRWLGLGLFLAILGITPGLAGLAGLASLVWSIVLLITTASSATKQGMHDRFAGSAVARPIGASNALVYTCLIVILVLPVIALLAIISLIAIGSQVSTILSTVGESV